YSIDTVLSRSGILFQRGFFHDTLFRGHDHVMAVNILLVLQVLGTDKGLHRIIVLYIDQVLDGTSLGGFGAFRNFIYPHPETFALLRKEQHVLVVGPNK